MFGILRDTVDQIQNFFGHAVGFISGQVQNVVEGIRLSLFRRQLQESPEEEPLHQTEERHRNLLHNYAHLSDGLVERVISSTIGGIVDFFVGQRTQDSSASSYLAPNPEYHPAN